MIRLKRSGTSQHTKNSVLLGALAGLVFCVAACSSDTHTPAGDPSISGAWDVSEYAAYVEYSVVPVGWESGTWESSLGDAVISSWVAPHAYRIGIISGSVAVRVVVYREGPIWGPSVIECIGHESLCTAAVANSECFRDVPYPSGFSGDSLVVDLVFRYPPTRTNVSDIGAGLAD